jgi:hypothetical protein
MHVRSATNSSWKRLSIFRESSTAEIWEEVNNDAD